ncbi:hypothetical protein D5086_006112 [Populus alba]|uniref:Uncharacterized protein n=1 Tax=Populus alba TaxID=43335 RepID=A0ACC4CKX8_POPAL
MSVVLNHSGSVSEEMSNSSENQVESLPQSIEEKHQELVVRHVPIVSSFNERIRPLLDAVDKLRHLQFCVRNLVNKEMEEEIVQELVGRHDGAIEKMLEESPAVAAKREKLNVSIKLLRESNNVLANIMDKIASNV